MQENHHFAPYVDQIALCSTRFNLIAQLETAEEHIAQLKREVPSLENFEFPASRVEDGKDLFSSEELTALAFANLTVEHKLALDNFYFKEKLLLGYTGVDSDNFPFLSLHNCLTRDCSDDPETWDLFDTLFLILFQSQ